jgi:DNA-binding response OmpR family regulator
MVATPRALAGKHILIVEDERDLALMLDDLVTSFGCTPVGPCNTLAGALKAIERDRFDIVLLDVDLCGQSSYPVAEALADRRIPFLYTSGDPDLAIPYRDRGWKLCPKPFTAEQLIAALANVLIDASPPW